MSKLSVVCDDDDVPCITAWRLEHVRKQSNTNNYCSRYPSTYSAIGFQDLSPALQQEVQELQKRMAVELQPLVLESTLTMQKLLEAEDHEARCRLLMFFIDAEKKRLTTKKALAGMFSGDTSGLSSIPAEEQLTSKKDDDDDSDDSSSGGSKSILTDEPDAWG